MGPFELMDLVGIDVGFEVAKSFTELSFGEPRWKPSPLQARMVAAGRLGRKTGRGWYDYPEEGPYRPPDPEPLEPGGGSGTVAIRGEGPLAEGLRERAAVAGFEVGEASDARLIVDAGLRPGPPAAAGTPRAVLCASASLAALGDRAAVGFHLLPPLDESRLVELTGPGAAGEATERFFGALGFHREWVWDAPGLVLGRIVCQLVNEAWFAWGERVGSAPDIDKGLTLGLSHPRGPIAWGDAIGLAHVVAVLDGLWEERHEERYRVAPMLRRAVDLEASGSSGE